MVWLPFKSWKNRNPRRETRGTSQRIYIPTFLHAKKKGRRIQKKIYGQTYKTLFRSSGLISTIFTIVCGNFSFIYFVFSSLYLCTTPTFFLLLNFDFVLRNREDLDDFTFVVLQFRAFICQPCRGFHTPVASCIPHCISMFDVVEARNCSFFPLHPPPAPKGFMWGVASPDRGVLDYISTHCRSDSDWSCKDDSFQIFFSSQNLKNTVHNKIP